MVWTLIINGTSGLIMLITYAFFIQDIDYILEPQHGFPFIPVFVNATQSVAGATGMTSIMLAMQACACISNVATTSRQMYAFARDGGLPFSSFFSKVNTNTFSSHNYSVCQDMADKPRPSQIDSRSVVPLNALCVSFIIVCFLSLINIGSTVAFNAILSLGTASLLSSYIISISCLRLKRWRGEPLPPARWSMGKWSSTVETIAILFLIIAWVFTFFPLAREVEPMTMNWSSAIFGGVVLFSFMYYVSYAKNVYKGPVTRIRPWSEVLHSQQDK